MQLSRIGRGTAAGAIAWAAFTLPLGACGPAQPALFGKWEVVAFRIPGVSATSPEQARTRVGQTAEYAADTARFAEAACTSPTAAVREVRVADLAARFGAAPAAFGIEKEIVRVWEIACDGAEWTAAGAVLIELNEDRLLLPWDGVFYELARRE